MADINIHTNEDWLEFNVSKLGTILDPMIFRTAEVFFRGARFYEDPEIKWITLKKNIGSLFAFFDNLILEERLPIINYNESFERRLPYEELYLTEICNQKKNILQSVLIDGEAFNSTKNAAMQELRNHPPIPESAEKDILEELTAFDYDWRPNMEELNDTEEPKYIFNTFLLGCLLFTAYAQQAGAEHVIQPKKSRLYLAASLQTDTARYEMEDALFSRLREISNRTPENVLRTIEIPNTPSFLPYLLSFNDRSPVKLLNRALKLRNSREVKDYRDWRKELLTDLEKGRIALDKEKEIKQMTAIMERKINPNSDWSIKMSLSLTNIGLNLEVMGARIWGWLLRQLPGKRYRKLLMSLTVAEREYVKIDQHLKQLWDA